VLEPIWDARAAGWSAGEHHFHLNYGGPYWLEPADLLTELRAEGMDVATPLLANLHTRFGEQRYWGWERSVEPPLIAFGQEIRSHFLGHLYLLGIRDLFWPWVWGPGYEVYGRDDRTNATALAHARAQGGIGGYVHPVVRREPFATDVGRTVPIELVPDAVLGDVDLLEVACLWSDELGTSEVWYRLLNVGRPVAASAGTDVMSNLYRTMAPGTTRVYVQTGEPLNLPAYFEGLAQGRSFVTTGPVLLLAVGGAEPGDAIAAGPGSETEWTLELRSAMPVDSVEILVNGEVVWRDVGLEAAGARSYSGALELPAGGWIAARARGGETRWPAMDSYPFAHTSPVWIGEVGSTDAAAAARSAQELLGLLDTAEHALREGYGTTPIPNLTERFRRARVELESYVGP
jgi:TolB protein